MSTRTRAALCRPPAAPTAPPRAACVHAARPLIPPGYVVEPKPDEPLRQGSDAAAALVGRWLSYYWPDHGWHVGEITDVVSADEGVRDRGMRAIVHAEWIETDGRRVHAFHALPLREWAREDAVAALPHSWVLLRRTDAAATEPRAPAPRGDAVAEGCGHVGCHGCRAAFSPRRLLQHVRDAHDGAIDTARLERVGGERCPTCYMPFVSLRGHYRKDPATGEVRCPCAIRATTHEPVLTDADRAFVASLTHDEVYISDVPSMLDVDARVASEWAASVAPFMRAYNDAPDDDLALRTLFVVMTALSRPIGRQRQRSQAIQRRCEALARGDELERLWRDVCEPRQRNERLGSAQRARAAAGDGEQATAGCGGDPTDGPAAPRVAPSICSDELRRRRAVRCAYDGERGRGRRALEGTGELGCVDRRDVTEIGPDGEAVAAKVGSVVDEMLRKHPPPPADSDDARGVPSLEQLLRDAGGDCTTAEDAARCVEEQLGEKQEAFARYVRRLDRCSMPSCDTVRFEHIQRFAASPHHDDLFRFVTHVLHGRIPAASRPYFFGARMLCPEKPDGGHRPIGEGSCFRRLAVGFAIHVLSGDIGARLGPVQLGVGVRDGTAIFANTVRTALTDHPEWVGIKCDFRNAFNEVSRTAFLRFIARNFPALLLVMLSAYGAPVYITALGSMGWVRFLSRRGCTQGCPAGGLCFAAALQEVLEATQAAFPGCIVIATHDDVVVCGPPAQARAALEHLLEAATRLCGLTPSGHKFTIYTSDGSSIGTSALAAVEAAVARWTDQAQLDAGKRCVAQADGIVAAGVPIGTMSFSIACLREKVASQERAHAQLRRLGERYTQIAYLLLRYCLVTRFGFWLRTVPPTVLLHVADGAPSVLQSVDSRQRDTLACILTDSDDATADALPALALEPAALPAKRGGVGLISHIAICHAAYVAGYTVALAYMREHHSRLLVTPSAADSDGAPTRPATLPPSPCYAPRTHASGCRAPTARHLSHLSCPARRDHSMIFRRESMRRASTSCSRACHQRSTGRASAPAAASGRGCGLLRPHARGSRASAACTTPSRCASASACRSAGFSRATAQPVSPAVAAAAWSTPSGATTAPARTVAAAGRIHTTASR